LGDNIQLVGYYVVNPLNPGLALGYKFMPVCAKKGKFGKWSITFSQLRGAMPHFIFTKK